MKVKVPRLIRKKTEKKPELLELYNSIQGELNKVENLLLSIARSPNKLISEVGEYLFQKKGKRIRPALLILCSRLFDYKGEEHIALSAVVEIIHTASLIHDDIVDKSTMRRGRQTIHAKWGPNVTVLLGDYLYIKSIELALKSSYSQVIELLAETSARMIEGEIYEYYMSGNLETSEEDYLQIINKKTASLFSASCQLGGIVGNATELEKQSLADYGTKLGMSFQVIDDLLDYTGEEKTLGKPVLSDLKEGRITLPLIYTLRKDGSTNQKRIKRILESKNLEKESQEEIIDIISSNGALDYTFEKAKEFSEDSKKSISLFPDSIYRDALCHFADFILTRKK
ncbi:MAG: polyprenyl synthetase family protein [Candidatus Aminicenantales bacterium]